ncbi:glycoside hydrolase family 19 protein [Gemmobacter lanyuensis]|nr:glycoside hydrolase family 19 protein [Gemmobacter lanyuensis]
MQVTAHTLAAIAGAPVNSNMRSVIAGLRALGTASGLDVPHRLAHYLGQIAHESGGWRWDREIWGATPAQARYDTRADLGNTPARDGDGYLYRGRGPIQITGKANYRQYRDWCRGIGQPAPDFVAQPDMVLLDPWEGIAPIWYWETRGLNRLADANNLDGITRAINGGDNGQVDRRDRYVRAALVLLGYGPTQIREFQRAWSIGADGIAGPTTRATLHAALTDQPPVKFGD